jgi:hypothetical protein
VLHRQGYRLFPVSRLAYDSHVRMLLKEVLHQLPRSLVVIHDKNAVLRRSRLIGRRRSVGGFLVRKMGPVIAIDRNEHTHLCLWR